MTGQTAKTGSTIKLTAEDADAFLAAGLTCARMAKWDEGTLADAVDLAKRLIEEQSPILPLGVLADLHAVLTRQHSMQRQPADPLRKRYEHQVLGRLIVDPLIDRAAAAIAHYRGHEKRKAIAFAVKQMIHWLRVGGVTLPAANLRELSTSVASLMTRTADSPAVMLAVEQLIEATRRTAEFMSKEDLIALEHGTAVMDLATFVAHRQVLHLVRKFEAQLPPRPPRPMPGRREVPTAIREDDYYPTGGYSSISTRGSLESLLHSQLAYMEDENPPDLFDAKFVRNELYYYSRDDNRFLRKRRQYAIHFDGDLVESRVKDRAAPAQRLVLAMSVVLAVIRKLNAWLNAEAIDYKITLHPALAAEERLLRILLRDELQRNGVSISLTDKPDFAASSRNLLFTAESAESDEVVTVQVDANPILTDRGTVAMGWDAILPALLQMWI